MKLISIVMLITLALILIFTSGCLPSRGWEVKFGISPVSRVDNKQGLDQEVSYKKVRAESN